MSSANLLASLVSEGYSIFTAVTSVLPSVASAASAAAASSAASAASNSATTTSASSFVTSTSASSTSPSTSASATALSSSVAAASASASSASDTAGKSHNGGGHNNLAIILGSVLGALALGLLILALILCCRRRRRRSRDSTRSHAMHPSGEEFDSWRQPKTGHHHKTHHNAHNKEVLAAGAVGAPLMAEHPAFRDEHEHRHQNPFVPVPPPPRRSAQNSRGGLTDDTVRGDHTYLMDEKTGRPLDRKSGDSHHAAGALAAGAGGAALGAAAMHHHNKNKEHELHDKHAYDHGSAVNRSNMTDRKPLPIAAAAPMGHNPNVYPTPSTNDDAFALNKPRRASIDSSRTRPSRDANRANEVFNRQYSSSSDERRHNHMGTAAALGASAIGGAALAHHHHHHQGQKPHSRSPHRNTFPPSRNHNDNSDSSNGREYADALPQQLHNVPIIHPAPHHHEANMTATAVHTLPHSGNDAYDIPPPPPRTHNRHNSALGAGAPAAAATAAYISGNHAHSHARSRSGSRSASLDNQTANNAFRPSAVPSRSPHRNSGSPHRTTPPLRHSGGGAFPIGGVPSDFESRSIVSDNGYPHMNLPRRQSGGVDDYAAAVSADPVPAVGGLGGNPPMHTDREMGVDDSAWRLSHGMPGGWQRSHSPANRYSSDLNRVGGPISSIHDGNGGNVTGGGRGGNQRDSTMSGSTAVGGGGAGGRRTRLADMRRDEEQVSMLQGRESMGSEWAGNGGYDGYQGHHDGHGHHQGVGQAM